MREDYKYNYTYRITNIRLGKYYYGAHSSDIEPSLDLGVKYFSSSRKEFVADQKDNRQDYKYKIIKMFKTRTEALRHEVLLHAKFNVKMHEKFYNDANATSDRFSAKGIKGRKHSEKTKSLMKENGISGKTMFNNGLRFIYLSLDEAIPEGFNKGGLPMPSTTATFKGSGFYTNLETGKSFRSKEIPDGDNIISGRIYFKNNGFDKVNSGIYENQIFNLMEYKFEEQLVTKERYLIHPYLIRCPLPIELRKLYIYDKILFLDEKDYITYLRNNDIVVIYKEKLSKDTIMEFKGRAVSLNKHCRNYNLLKGSVGGKYSDFGYHFFVLRDYLQYKEKYEYIFKEGEIWEKKF